MYRDQSLRLIYDPVKGVFVPLFVLSFATIIIGTINYAVPSGHVHPTFVYHLFWCAFASLFVANSMNNCSHRVYMTLAVVVCFPMLMIWYNQKHPIETFTPAYAFLVFPMMVRIAILKLGL